LVVAFIGDDGARDHPVIALVQLFCDRMKLPSIEDRQNLSSN
jgi:hypothetical protein